MSTDLDPAEYIRQLPAIPADHPALVRDTDFNTDPDILGTATVAGNSLISFVSEVDKDHAEQLLYALGYAQLQSSNPNGYNWDPRKNPIEYYESVVYVLRNIGFVVQDLNIADFNFSSRTASLDVVVGEILAGLLSGPSMALVEGALTALKASADKETEPWVIFKRDTKENTTGGFSVGTAAQSTGPDGTPQVALSLSANAFRGVATNTQFLWAHFNTSDVSIKWGTIQLATNDELWNSEGVGDVITKIMREHAVGYIAGLPPIPKKRS